MSKVTFPYGGYIRWQHREFTYAGNRTLREVHYRYLVKAPGAPESSYLLTRDDAGDAGRSIHSLTIVTDPTWLADRVYWFNTDTSQWYGGLLSSFDYRQFPGAIILKRSDYSWTQSASGNPYIWNVDTYLDLWTANQKQMRTQQAVDAYGNVTQMTVYDYGNVSTPARTYNYGYLNNPSYISAYIRNRLTSATVTEGAQTITLATNVYDQQGYNGIFNCPSSWHISSSNVSDPSQLRNHDSANYGISMHTRGNVSIATARGVSSCFSYDITGNIVQMRDAANAQTLLSYNPVNRYAVPSLITPNSNGSLSTSTTWDAALGLTGQTGPNGANVTFTYDALHRPSTAKSPHGAITTFTYFTNPHIQKATTNGRWTDTHFDGFGRPTIVASGHGSTYVSLFNTEYDSCACSPLGKVKHVSQPYAPGGAIYWTTYSYDALGRTISIAHPDNSGTTNYLYEGNTVKVTDPAGKWKRFVLNAMGNLTQVIEPNPAGGADLVTNYSYNGADKLVQVSMTRGATTQTRTFVYNASHQLQSAANPETGTVTYTYNPNGTVATKTDAKNQVMGYTYDTYKRVTKITRAGNACQTIDYWYDANPHDGSWSVNTWSRVAAIQYGGHNCQGGLFQEFYKYTAAGLPAAKKLRFWRNNSWYELASAHGYDNEGRNASITYPGHYVWDTEDGDVWTPGPTYTYTFDPMGRPTKLTQGGANPIDWAKDVTYNAAGQITQMKYPRAYNWWGAYLVETRSYNNRQEMTRLTVAGQADWEYRFSATQNNGQITQTKDWVTGEEVTYQYDSLKRLISAVTTGPEWGLSFSYDGFGNKTGQNVTKGSAPVMNLSFNELTNRINPQHGFSYDANGNVTGMPSMTNTYDAANRLTQVVHTLTGTQQYGYAPDNKRVWHKDAQNQEFFQYYDVSGKRLGSYRINHLDHITISYTHPSVAATNVYLGSKLIVSEGRTVVLDRLGSVRLREPAGCCGVFERVNYFPYGEGMTSAARNFATYERNPSTGVDYADQRYYSNIHGRFLTADPYVASAGVGDPGSWNRYGYVQGDPINFNDPLGLCRESATETSVTVCSGPIEPLQYEWMRYYYSGAYDYSSPYSSHHRSLPQDREYEDRMMRLNSFSPESCTLSLVITQECGHGDGAHLAAGLTFGALARITGTVNMAWWVTVQAVGRAGETAVSKLINQVRNTAPLPGGRIPDFWSGNTIFEVKNASSVPLTNQIWDFMKWAAEKEGRRFELWIRRGANLSDDLKKAEEMGLVTIKWFTWP